MNIWYIVFFVAFAFFIIKTIISLCLGDVDVDFDSDGDVDFDLSSMFSFKGILHFILGISTYMSIIAKFDPGYTGYGYYNYTWYHYLIGIGIGFLFMFLLFKLYQLMMKLNHSNTKNPNFDNCDCSILINNGGGSYTVLVRTPLGTYKINARANGLIDNLKIGDEYKVIYHKDYKEYFLNN